MRNLLTLGVVFTGLLAQAARAQPVKATAVFTVDTVEQSFPYEPGDRLDVRFRSWASACSPKPNGPLFLLVCPKVETPETPPAQARQVTAVAVLFRDLDETLYLAACPLIETPPEPSSQAQDGPPPEQSPGAERDESGVRLRDQARCEELEEGQTFSAEVEGAVIRIVARGRPLPLTLIAEQPKVLALGDPRLPKVADVPPSARSRPIDPSQLPPQPEPKWSPPPLTQIADNSSKPAAGEGVPRAKTDLRTGRFVLECGSGPAEVYVDATYVGTCPMDLPLVAGPHNVTVRRVRKEDWVRDFRVEAGETVRLKVTAE